MALHGAAADDFDFRAGGMEHCERAANGHATYVGAECGDARFFGGVGVHDLRCRHAGLSENFAAAHYANWFIGGAVLGVRRDHWEL